MRMLYYVPLLKKLQNEKQKNQEKSALIVEYNLTIELNKPYDSEFESF